MGYILESVLKYINFAYLVFGLVNIKALFKYSYYKSDILLYFKVFGFLLLSYSLSYIFNFIVEIHKIKSFKKNREKNFNEVINLSTELKTEDSLSLINDINNCKSIDELPQIISYYKDK